MRNIFANRKRLAVASALAVGLLAAAGTVLVNPTKAFTLIELTMAPNPVELIGLDSANVVLTNLSATEVAVQINWGDAVSGATLKQFNTLVMPGQGFITALPAVQTPASVNLPAVQSHAVVAVIHVSAAPGGAPLTADITRKILATINVIDGSTQKVTVSHGLAPAPTLF